MGELRKLLYVSLIPEAKRDLSGIDAGIQDLVFDLQEAGYSTLASCEGGEGHSEPWGFVSVCGKDLNKDDLERVVAASGKGPYRVTVRKGDASIEVFPTADVAELKRLVAQHGGRGSYMPLKAYRRFDDIKTDYARGDQPNRDYGRGRRLQGVDDNDVRYAEFNDVIYTEEWLAHKDPNAHAQLVDWLTGHHMSWNDIDVIWEKRRMTFVVYPKDDHHSLVSWSGTAWKPSKS